VTLSLVGPGLPRTGTTSLTLAAERLLGGCCYNMAEVFGRLEDVPVWRRALRGELPDWEELLGDYTAAVSWPASAFWRELVDAYPDAVVVLSTRQSAEAWWRSADATILELARREEHPREYGDWPALFDELLRARLGPRWDDPDAAMAAYTRHNEGVRAAVPPARLVEWRPVDGWEPLCAALGVPVPDEPFPHTNSTEEWRATPEPAGGTLG
jgi:hypothetical protein